MYDTTCMLLCMPNRQFKTNSSSQNELLGQPMPIEKKSMGDPTQTTSILYSVNGQYPNSTFSDSQVSKIIEHFFNT